MNTRPMLMVAVLTAVLIAGAADDVLAQAGRGPAAVRGDCEAIEPGPMRLEAMTRRLDLTAEQQEAIAAHRSAARGKNRELRKQMMRLRHELRGEMLKDAPEERAVVQLTERIGELRTELQANRARLELAIRGELTDEQRDEMLLMRGPDGRSDRSGRHGRRAGPRLRDDCPLDDEDGPRGPRRRPGRS